MNPTNPRIEKKDLKALDEVINLVRKFFEMNIIKRYKVNFNQIENKLHNLKENAFETEEKKAKFFIGLLNKLKSAIQKEIIPELLYIIGGHGGIIIDDTGFCEFDIPEYSIKQLLKRMRLAIKTGMPYNLEIAISCLEWLDKNSPMNVLEFQTLFKKGRFEIINPSYSQPYNLIIGEESNIKQFEHGLKILRKLDIDCKIYYCSEASYHPQIPQILKGFDINYASLRTRLLGQCPTSPSGIIYWQGLDGTSIATITDQSGVFNGEYFHGTFFREIPNLLFQAVARPFMDHIIYSSLEDFIMPLPLQEDIWRISKYSDVLGKFISCTEIFDAIKLDGQFKYTRDFFSLGKYIFVKSDLFLNNKNCEIALASAEIFNCILGLFNEPSNDTLLEDLWSRFLLTQAHDNYAVPFTHHGDYSAQQLSPSEYEDLNIKIGSTSISELSIKIQREIQTTCDDFMKKSLKKLIENLRKHPDPINMPGFDFLIFNPTNYRRRDVVEIPIELDNPSKMVLLSDKDEVMDFTYENSTIKFLPDVQSIGYKIYSLVERDERENEGELNFLYEIEIKAQKIIEISYNNTKVYELKFNASSDYTLSIKENKINSIENKYLIQGKVENRIFNLEIIQYNGVNRLEFILDSLLLNETILTPSFQVSKSFINYPFGIEETKRSNIQTLDFLWLMGSEKSIIYIQKNSQKFLINRENFEIRNSVKPSGIYEFSISIIQENNFLSVYHQLYLYKFNLLGTKTQGTYEYFKKEDLLLSLNPEINLINLWRRDNQNYLRILNPSNIENRIKLGGLLIKDNLKLMDFNYQIIKDLEKNEIFINPWKILTLNF